MLNDKNMYYKLGLMMMSFFAGVLVINHLLLRGEGWPSFSELTYPVAHGFIGYLVLSAILSMVITLSLSFFAEGGEKRIFSSLFLLFLGLVTASYALGVELFEWWFDYDPIATWNTFKLLVNPELSDKFITAQIIAFTPLIVGIFLYLFRHKLGEHPFGNAHFADLFEVQQAGFLKKEEESIIIGKKCGMPLYSNGFEHVLCFAPPGSGKTSAIAIPNLFHYPYSVVCNDVKLTLYETTSGYREKTLGHQCFVWAPADKEGRTHRFNPLSLISKNKEQRISDIQRLAHIFIPNGKGDARFWAKSSRALFQALILYVLDSEEHLTTMGEIGRLIKQADFFDWFQDLARHTEHLDSNFYDNANMFLANDEKTLKNIYSDLTSYFEIFDDPRINAATSASDFDITSLRKQKTTIYIGFTDDDMERLSPLLNLFWEQLTSVMIQHIPKKEEEPFPVLFLIDEFASLGRIERLRRSLKLLREYRVRCVLMMQYLAQTLEQYNQSEAKAFTNIKTKIAFSTDDIQDAELLSKLLGTRTKKINTGSQSIQERGNSRTKSYNLQAVPLMRPEQIMRMQQISSVIIRTGHSPIKARQIRWYSDRTFNKLNIQSKKTHRIRAEAVNIKTTTPKKINDNDVLNEI
jgi:type IV secretion system protein VirD4